MPITKSSRALLNLHSSALLFGMAGLFASWLTLNPLLIVLGRVFFASITLAIILKFKKQAFRLKSRRDRLRFVALGFLLAFHWTTFFHSIQLSTLAIALFSFSTFPLFTFLLEALILKVPLGWSNFVLVLISLCGLYLVVPIISWSESPNELGGLFWGLASALSFALLAIANRALSGQYSAWQISFHQDLWAAMFLVPVLFFLDFQWSAENIGLLILLGTVFTALAHGLYISSLKEISATTASLVIALEPVYGVMAALILFNEVPSIRTISGGLLILSASLYVSIIGRRPLKIKPTL
jgi:drug/metabolite transporter (DMT)-like permease